MSPTKWTTDEQAEWLDKHFGAYLEQQKMRKYTPFWDALFPDWFKEYPEADQIFSGRMADSLTEDEKESLKEAIKA
jgi:hypothetical protein